MKNLKRTLTLFITIFIVANVSTFAQKPELPGKISRVIKLYEKALNNNSVEAISELFVDDGILLLQGSPTIIGTESIQKFYTTLFNAIDFDLIFNIDEVVEMSAEWSFVRTTTTGTVKVLSNNSIRKGNGHEIFILKRETDGNWKVARYAGSSAG